MQLQATIANAQKMMGEDYEGTKKLEDEKEYAQTQVHYMRRLHVHIQMNESATYQLKQLRSERSLKKAQLKAAGVDVGDDEGDHRGLANAGATTPSPRGKGKKAKGSRKGTATAGSAGSEKGSPKRSARSGDQETRSQLCRNCWKRQPAGQSGQLSWIHVLHKMMNRMWEGHSKFLKMGKVERFEG